MQAELPLRLRQFLIFARNWLREPLNVGTFAPSSIFVVRSLLRRLDWKRIRVLVEYGPGVGTITVAMLRRMGPGAQLIAIETNAEFVDFMRRSIDDPRLTVVHGSAADVRAALAAAGHAQADCIVSGIPFSTMPSELRDRILAETAQALGARGRFAVYQYTGRVYPHLSRFFGTILRGIEWRNLVPMRLFWCEPRAADAATATHTPP